MRDRSFRKVKSGGADFVHRVGREAVDTAPSPQTRLILAGRDGRRRVALAVDAAAQAAGLRVDTSATIRARRLLQGSTRLIRGGRRGPQDRSRDVDAEALRDDIAADLPDLIVIDTAGSDHLHGCDTIVLTTMAEKLAGVGIRAHAGIAGNSRGRANLSRNRLPR